VIFYIIYISLEILYNKENDFPYFVETYYKIWILSRS